MTIQLVSLHKLLTADARLKLVSEIINESSADLIMFAGHTLLYKEDISRLRKFLNNKVSVVLFETKDGGFDNGGNHLYRLEGGKIVDMKSRQIFKDSDQIDTDKGKALKLLDELEQDTKRHFNVKDKRCIVLQCGELNILKNYQKEGNRVAFRYDNDPDLEKRFFDIIEHVDIILNPMHTPMGNQPKMGPRRILLSSNGRAYFSTSNALNAKTLTLKHKSLQYALKDGLDLREAEDAICENSYIIRSYEL